MKRREQGYSLTSINLQAFGQVESLRCNKAYTQLSRP